MPTNGNAAGDLPEANSDLKDSLTINQDWDERFESRKWGRLLNFCFKASEGYSELKLGIQQITRAADE